MRGLSVDAEIDPDEDLFGKTVADLQENVGFGPKGLTGKVKYVADYSSAYGSGEDSGNYLVLHFDVPGETGVTLTAELVNGVHGPQELDSDGICIFRITDKSSQYIRIVASKDGCVDVTRTVRLNNLTLEAAE